MSINLKKGSSLNLTKKEPGLKKVLIGLGWENIKSNPLDLDASVFMTNSAGKLPKEEFFVFYNNKNSPDGSVKHFGDSRTGISDDDADDEVIAFNMENVDPTITEILVYVTINDAASKGHTFGKLSNAFVRIVNAETNVEICKYDLDAENTSDTEVLFGKLVKTDSDWTFIAMGQGTASGLESIVNLYI